MRTPAEQEQFLTEERFLLAKPYTFPAWLELYTDLQLFTVLWLWSIPYAVAFAFLLFLLPRSYKSEMRSKVT